jgi:hypothetical protein
MTMNSIRSVSRFFNTKPTTNRAHRPRAVHLTGFDERAG